MDLFDIELLNYDPSTPSFYLMMVSALFAFFLSSAIAITYDLTTPRIERKGHFLQSLALIGIVAATVMQAIGDSVAVGLGMLGALSIIRFRTVMNNPRNITFMFASLAAGIATGVLGYGIALTGTAMFCLAAVILRFSPLHVDQELNGEIRLHVPKHDDMQSEIEHKMRPHCSRYELEQVRFLNPKKVNSVTEKGFPAIEEIDRTNLKEYTYKVKLKKKATITSLTNSLEQIDGLEELRLNFSKQPIDL
jgi:uncharacterized membrane protein YhiD involved in acid resistance